MCSSCYTVLVPATCPRDLHRRLGLTGPDDELKDLGDTFDGLHCFADSGSRVDNLCDYRNLGGASFHA